MSDDKLYDEIERATQARYLLENAVLWDCFNILERDYILAWKATPARDAMAREKWWIAVNMIGKLRENLITVLNNGKLAQADLSLRAKVNKAA